MSKKSFLIRFACLAFAGLTMLASCKKDIVKPDPKPTPDKEQTDQNNQDDTPDDTPETPDDTPEIPDDDAPDDIPVVRPTGESGLYLGIIGFNQRLSTYPIQLLNKSSKPGFDSFINSLNNDNNGTPVYYATANGISVLNSITYPNDIINASIITFTDGIDNYSLEKVDGYSKADDYGDAVHRKLMTETVAGLNINAYAIGLKSAGVNAETFKATLGRIASSQSNVFEAEDMAAVKNKFKEIAQKIYESSNQLNVTVSIPGGLDDGSPIRFTFDTPKQGAMTSDKADNSTLYIEGVYHRVDRQNRYIRNVTCKGLKIANNQEIRGTLDESTGLINFTFESVELENNRTLNQNNIYEWWGSPWQFDDEFVSGENTKLIETKRTAAIVLVLDCTKSLGESLFKDMQASAKSFIDVLLQNSLSESEKVYPTSVSLNKTSWRTKTAGETVSLSATVYPSDATDKSVTYSSSDPSVAAVNASGVVTAVAEGTATITARTSNGKTATCAVTVKFIPEGFVDLGLPSGLLWAECNLGATTPSGYGNYYAWGESSTKSSYAESNSTTSGKSLATLKSSGIVDANGNLTANYDVAQKLGKGRMPTKAEQDELRTKCTWTWTSQNGVNGYRVTGPNGNSIFLPAAGCRFGSSSDNVGSYGYYWSSTAYDDIYFAYILGFYSGNYNWYSSYYDRYRGRSVRPVTE